MVIRPLTWRPGSLAQARQQAFFLPAALLGFPGDVYLDEYRHPFPVFLGLPVDFPGQTQPVQGMNHTHIIYYIFNFVGLQPPNQVD